MEEQGREQHPERERVKHSRRSRAAPANEYRPHQHIYQEENLSPKQLEKNELSSGYRGREQELNLCRAEGEGGSVRSEDPPAEDREKQEERPDPAGGLGTTRRLAGTEVPQTQKEPEIRYSQQECDDVPGTRRASGAGPGASS